MALSKGPGEADTEKEIAALRRELQHIEAKDGKFTEWENKRVDALNQILDAEPPLRNLLVNLDVRQRKEISALADQQKQLPVSDEKTYAISRKQYSDLEERHSQERERYIRDYQHARALDQTPAPLQNRANTKGAAMPADDREFAAKVPFTQDPEFIKLQRDLQMRQERERKDLENRQTEQRIEFGRQAGVTREQLEQNYKRQLQERETLSRKHKAEDNRYTRDYHDAKVLREDLREKEKTEALERGQDGPKRSR